MQQKADIQESSGEVCPNDEIFIRMAFDNDQTEDVGHRKAAEKIHYLWRLVGNKISAKLFVIRKVSDDIS